MIDFATATADDREQCLGRNFRSILVTGFDPAERFTMALIDGRLVALVGDPQSALTTYLGGTDPESEGAGQ